MGLFDTVALPEGMTLPGLETDPATVEWQTKTIDRPMMRQFRLTSGGQLLQEETRTESVPEEERPYHGTFEFHASVEGELARCEAKFTDGQLVAVRDVNGADDSGWIPAEEILPGENDGQLSGPEAERLIHLLDSLAEEVAAIDDDSVRECVQRVRAYLDRRGRAK